MPYCHIYMYLHRELAEGRKKAKQQQTTEVYVAFMLVIFITCKHCLWVFFSDSVKMPVTCYLCGVDVYSDQWQCEAEDTGGTRHFCCEAHYHYQVTSS